MNIQGLTASEKVLMAGRLWESVLAEADVSYLSDEQKAEQDKHLEACELDPYPGDSWAAVKARLLK
jgi:putative addiction module component (TIGR02574 family)